MFMLLSLVPKPVCIPPSAREIVVEQKENSPFKVLENNPIPQEQICDLQEVKEGSNSNQHLYFIAQQREGERRTFEIPILEETTQKLLLYR